MKSLINKSTNEYCCWMDGHIYTGEIPQLLPDTCTIKLMKEYDDLYWSKQSVKPQARIDWDEYNLINVTVLRN